MYKLNSMLNVKRSEQPYYVSDLVSEFPRKKKVLHGEIHPTPPSCVPGGLIFFQAQSIPDVQKFLLT